MDLNLIRRLDYEKGYNYKKLQCLWWPVYFQVFLGAKQEKKQKVN